MVAVALGRDDWATGEKSRSETGIGSTTVFFLTLAEHEQKGGGGDDARTDVRLFSAFSVVLRRKRERGEREGMERNGMRSME